MRTQERVSNDADAGSDVVSVSCWHEKERMERHTSDLHVFSLPNWKAGTIWRFRETLKDWEETEQKIRQEQVKKRRL